MRRLPLWLALSAALVAAGPASAAPSAGATIVSALAGPPRSSFLARIRAGEMGGVILVGRWKPAELLAATRRLHSAGCAAGRPLLVMVDQEGGWARRLTWANPVHTAGELGRLGIDRVRAEAGAAARSLRAAGIDIDLAPVADTLGPGGFLGDRSFGTHPEQVGGLAAAFVQALQRGRVAATAKHFPGLGAARVSTDDHRVSLGATYLDPFGRAIGAGAKLVMVSNAIYPALDAAGTPAVFSRPIVTGLLRGTFGFNGLVVSDALDAPTPARTPHATARALAAGVDLLLYTSSGAAHAAYEQLRSDTLASALVRARLAEAVGRIHTLEVWLGRTCG